jgi:SAM-dependent methyltransferase
MWSAADAGLDLKLRPALARYASGAVLDIGCGQAPYRPLIVGLGLTYFGSDVTPTGGPVDFVADACALPIADASVGTVLCSEVLEHLPNPTSGFNELVRILRPGGHLVLSVPFLARIHEAPRDYFRFTKFSLQDLVTQYGLELIELSECGAIFTFLAHQAASVFVSAAFGLNPWIGQVAAVVSGLVLTGPAIVLDKIPGLSAVYPAGYLLVARKAGTA